MTTLREAVKARLEADTELMNILTGTIFDANDLEREGLTVRQMPKATNGVNLLPCALIRFRNANPDGPHFNAEVKYFDITFYENAGTVNIEAAMRRVKDLLHRTQVTSTNEGIRWITWGGDTGEFVAEELGNVPADRSRYRIQYTRR